MGQLVLPKVYFVGCTEVNVPEVMRYLRETNQLEFFNDYEAAIQYGVPSGMALCSMFAKLCYKSLVTGKNANVTRTRSIVDNLEGCFNTAHGSVFEHCQLNFLVTNCSRIFTHELVRHRAGTAFSQTSGRYCRLDSIDLVWDPILDTVSNLFEKHTESTEIVVYLAECRLGLRKPPSEHPDVTPEHCIEGYRQWNMNCVRFHPNLGQYKWVPDPSFNFERRKKITSAIRRIAPNGQANEIAFSVNVRQLRHMVQVRTSRHAEREIRDVFVQVHNLVRDRCPLMFHGAKVEVYDGLPEISGMKLQPYERTLEDYSNDEIKAEYDDRLQRAADENQ